MDAFASYLGLLISAVFYYGLARIGRTCGWWMALCSSMILSDLKAGRPAAARKNILMFSIVTLITQQQADSLTAKYFPEELHEQTA